MNSKHIVQSLILVLLSAIAFSVTRAQLTVQDPTVYGTKPGYIDQASIVIEPHGAFAEETMTLRYADHNQYAGNNSIEIVHRFTLPQGSVVNNMWLWIADTLIQAQMFSTWTARHIYDSIVVRQHDPAFLAKNGDTYELHIYPLVSGQYRQCRMNFIVPTQWIGDSGFAEFPLGLLKGNNASARPVVVSFKEAQDVWGVPFVREFPLQTASRLYDSAGYKFREFAIGDVSYLNSFTLGFQIVFDNGIFGRAIRSTSDTSYFQVGIDPTSFHATKSDTGAMSVLVGLDVSGSIRADVPGIMNRVKDVLHRSLRPVDRFRLVVSGRDTVARVTGWLQASSALIDTTLDSFVGSPLAARVAGTHRPTVVFCDDHAQTIWRFPSLDSIATILTYSDIVSAQRAFSKADIVASYDHGFESSFTTSEHLESLLNSIDSLFARGGRFLGYFDHNRPGGEKIETHYINGLTENYPATTQTLFAQPDGNISAQFPPSITLNSVNYLTYNDPGVKVELANSKGEAAVISKRISNGLMVVSGVWSFVDDGALKQQMAVPLVGAVQSHKGMQMLQALLNDMRSTSNVDSIKEVFVFSNADSVIERSDADTWGASFLGGFTKQTPVFHTINLLDGSWFVPPYLTDQGTDYYGAGYLGNRLSRTTGGLHFETHLKPWTTICGALTFSTFAPLDSICVTPSPDAGSGTLYALREVNPEPNDPVRPRFFIGASDAKTTVDFHLNAFFKGLPGSFVKDDTAGVVVDTTRRLPVLASMLGWEHLKDLFTTSSSDTSAIVDLALQYNLLCDYTALIALEPKTNPGDNQDDNDGNNQSDVPQSDKSQIPLRFTFGAYPNPFNPQTTFYITLPHTSEITIFIYDILGREVRRFTLNASQGIVKFLWDGKDKGGRMVSTGIYFARAVIREKILGRVLQKVIKLALVK
jgi:hypothetical protein